MRIIYKPIEYVRLARQLKSLMPSQFSFPYNPFAAPPEVSAFITNGHVQAPGFISLRELCESVDEEGFYLFSISPTPIAFYRHFSYFPVAFFSMDDDSRTWQEFLSNDPGGRGADLLNYNIERAALFSPNGRFVGLACRQVEIFCVACLDKGRADSFAERLRGQGGMFMTIDDVAEYLEDCDWFTDPVDDVVDSWAGQ